MFALAAVNISVLNDTVFHFNSKKVQSSGCVVGFIYVEVEQFLLTVCVFFYSTLRQCLVQVGRVVLKHLLPHPQHARGRGRGYVKQSVD